MHGRRGGPFSFKKNQGLKAVGAAFNPHPPAIAVPKGDVEFVKWINKQLAKMKEDGTYEMFRRRYFGD